MTSAPQPRHRLKKQPHDLHRCATVDDLCAALRARDIDLVSLVHEFVKPAASAGILVTGSIADGIATEVSDLDLLVLLADPHDLKERRKREICGNTINYLPAEAPDTTMISLFLAGIELDLNLMVNPEVDRHAADPAPRREERSFGEHDPFLNRLATGWIVDGESSVRRWRRYYGTDDLRVRWMAAEFTAGAKVLEDMEAGIGLARGHASAIGAHVAMHLLSALLAQNGFFSTSPNWMLKIGRLLPTVDPAMRAALTAGSELAFPACLEDVDAERAYFDRMIEYCGTVRSLLSRQEGMADLLDSVIHDFDLIV